MKRLLIFLAAALLAGAGIYGWKHYSSGKAGEEPPATVKIERGPIRLSISSTGKVVSNLDVEIKCKASGEIIKLPFEVSESVRKGDLLLELDPADEQRRVDQAEVALSSSRAQLSIARENLTIAGRNLETDRDKAEAALKSAMARAEDARLKSGRVKELLEKNLSSREEYETAETTSVQASADLELARLKLDELKTRENSLEVSRFEVSMAEARMESDRIDLELARQRLMDTRVTAPIDGVVTSRNVQIGQIISSGISNVAGGTTTMVLSDLSRMFVLASVDESDIGKVSVGQPVEITVDAHPGKIFQGSVVLIATRGINVSNVVTFEVKIEVLSKSKSLLKPEMTANVEIIAAEKEDALLAPANAVVRMAGSYYVTLFGKNQTGEDRSVKIGISDGTRTEITEGLEEGDIIVLRSNGLESRWAGRDRERPPIPGGMIRGAH